LVATTHRGKVIHTIIVPIALLVVLAMAVVVGFVWFSAKKQDEIARRDSIVSVAAALDRHATHLGRIAKDFAWWNDAVENLILKLDLDWADQGIGFYAFENYGYETSFVVDGENRTIYSSANAARTEDQALAALRPGLDILLAQAREAAHDKPEPVTGIMQTVDGRILLVGASAIAPEDGAPFQLPAGPKFVLIFTKELDQGLLDSIGAALPLKRLRLIMAGEVAAEIGVLPLVAPDGSTLGTLVWQPHKPGQQFLMSVAPALSIAIILIGAFTYAVLRHARATTNAIEASEARFRDVADASSDWIWEVDAQLRLTFISERYALVTGKAPEASLGLPLAELFHPAENIDRWQHYLADLERWRSFRNVVSLCEDAHGIHRTVRLSGKPVFNTAGRPIGYRGTATDITAEIEAGRRAEYLAMHDALTGLPNRVLLLERLEHAIASVSRRRDMAALLLLDLDRFKDVNDTLGHPAGDLVLKEVAARLSACIREVDTVARIGGDEFAIVQVGIREAAEAQLLARRVLDLFQTPLELDGHESLVTASIGVALIPTDASIPAKLLQLADIALYRAKEDGRNASRFFEPEMDARLQRRKAIERELRLALSRDELELFYQPKISLLTDELAGVEALVRWRHPERGLVPPGEFIGIAEETGLILQLGEWVLRTAAHQASHWAGLQVSVNISPAQFRQPDLVQVVHNALRESGLAPQRLELEITESVLIQQPEAAAKLLDDLKKLGVRVAMDDFGTGYSSLSYLQRFHFDKIKVDRSFIGAIGIEPSAAAIVRAVINLASSLGMLTCAEGVETDEQLAALRHEGCSEVQGYLFGKPMPVHEFEAMYNARRSRAYAATGALAQAVAGS
jgi:diguanylate cyclase (GGDEF)-like protein/PAS domain S-box-containing protein